MSLFQHRHMTHHRTFYTPKGLSWWHKHHFGNNDVIIRSKTISKQSWPLSPHCTTVSSLSHDSESSNQFSKNPVCCHGGTSHRYHNKDVIFGPKTMSQYFSPFFPFVPPFQHCQMTQHGMLHKPTRLPWWHKPSLSQQWRYFWSKNYVQIFLTPCSSLSLRLNTVRWLSIEIITSPLRWYGGTSRRYHNNDVTFCPKTMAK